MSVETIPAKHCWPSSLQRVWGRESCRNRMVDQAVSYRWSPCSSLVTWVLQASFCHCAYTCSSQHSSSEGKVFNPLQHGRAQSSESCFILFCFYCEDVTLKKRAGDTNVPCAFEKLFFQRLQHLVTHVSPPSFFLSTSCQRTSSQSKHFPPPATLPFLRTCSQMLITSASTSPSRCTSIHSQPNETKYIYVCIYTT